MKIIFVPRKYYYLTTKFSTIISALAIFFVAGFALAYFLFPRQVQQIVVREIKIQKEPPSCDISAVVKDFVNQTCVLLSLDPTTDSIIGTGFFVEDTVSSKYLFLITVNHNFYDFYDSAGHAKKRWRDPVYFLCNSQQRDKNLIKVDKINTRKSYYKSKALVFHSDPGIELAIYHFEIDTTLTYHFLKKYMLLPLDACTTGTEIHVFSFITGSYNPEANLLKTCCKEGRIDTVAVISNISMIPKIFLKKDCAIVRIEDFIFPGESGSPVFFNLDTLKDITEIRLGGVLFERIGEKELATRLGKMVIGIKVKELIEEFYESRDSSTSSR